MKVGAIRGTVRSIARSWGRKLLYAGVIAFAAVSGPSVAHIRSMNKLARDMRGCFMRLWDLILHAWSRSNAAYTRSNGSLQGNEVKK